MYPGFRSIASLRQPLLLFRTPLHSCLSSGKCIQSLGEAAACVAGMITVREVVQIVLTRSTLHDKCSSNGLMAAMGISEEDTRELLTELNIAAVNGAAMVTVNSSSRPTPCHV